MEEEEEEGRMERRMDDVETLGLEEGLFYIYFLHIKIIHKQATDGGNTGFANC